MRYAVKFFVLCLLLAGWSGAAHGENLPSAAAIFGSQPTPITVSLGNAPGTEPPIPMAVRCYGYAGFVAKEIDLGEEGDDQISFLPLHGGEALPACRKANDAGELVVGLNQSADYFWGAFGGYAFLLAADGMNGGMEFTVVTPGNGKIIATSVMDRDKREPKARHAPGGVVFDFIEQATAECSVAISTTCAATIERQTGERIPMALCRTAYKEAGNTGGKLAAASPTVVDFPAEMTLIGDAGTTKPTGPINFCGVSE